MTKSELIQIAQQGERIPPQPYSLHGAEKPCKPHEHFWRTIVCDGDHDVVECAHCGAQSVAKCNFDEDFA